MTKKEFISAMAEKSGLTKKEASNAYDAFVSTVTEELKKGEKVQLIGFGNFEVIERAARSGRNPHTNEVLELPAKYAPKFKASKALKDVVNG